MFEGLRYPGHEKVVPIVIIGLIMAVMAATLDKAYMVTFGVAPVLVTQMIMSEAGLKWKTHPKASLLFFVGYLVWLGAVTVVRVMMLSAGQAAA